MTESSVIADEEINGISVAAVFLRILAPRESFFFFR
jgi:hypothetical protein